MWRTFGFHCWQQKIVMEHFDQSENFNLGQKAFFHQKKKWIKIRIRLQWDLPFILSFARRQMINKDMGLCFRKGFFFLIVILLVLCINTACGQKRTWNLFNVCLLRRPIFRTSFSWKEVSDPRNNLLLTTKLPLCNNLF